MTTSTQGKGSVLPLTNNEPPVTGGAGWVNDGGTVKQGTNLPGGKVQLPDGSIHG